MNSAIGANCVSCRCGPRSTICATRWASSPAMWARCCAPRGRATPTPICAPATPCRRWAGRCWPARRKGRCAACMSGKALELTALALGALEPARDAPPLSRADVERLHHARDLALANLQDPPGLPDLARRAGVNVNKLTTGFRKLFGQSVYAFVRERAWSACAAGRGQPDGVRGRLRLRLYRFTSPRPSCGATACCPAACCRAVEAGRMHPGRRGAKLPRSPAKLRRSPVALAAYP